jgi:hypothetical protein
MDIDRGARLTFHASDGRVVSIRYEPWIFPDSAARQNRDSVYRGRQGDAAWSPDILIEILAAGETEAAAAAVDYAIVVDAKYSRRIRQHHWEQTSKYLEVRATSDDRQIVKQIWLACPSEREAGNIVVKDATLAWTPQGPSCPCGEVCQGTIHMVPSIQSSGESDEPGWIPKPNQTAVEFIQGLLRYVGIGIS